ncbi:hypothetical protein [Snodgrassella alvi]|uniref:hypothetical protein n=1 Tax=Snodgrassella alvi TaxID=1196083 RepID=UPI0015D52DA2|nr:hypothetical protein [Snodgrassella alvi]
MWSDEAMLLLLWFDAAVVACLECIAVPVDAVSILFERMIVMEMAGLHSSVC